MYPTKHYISLPPTRSNMPRPPLVILTIAVFVIVCLLFFSTIGFGDESGRGGPSSDGKRGYEVLGPKPYFVGDVDERLSDVQNETLGFQEVFIVSVLERSDKLDMNILASSLTGFKFKVIPGIAGKDVARVSLPPTYDADTITKNIGMNTIGAWRSELNAVRQIITDRLSSALIMEDDMSWDVSLKNQLLDIARGGRFLSNQTSATAHSPYGDNWDVLWLGHCGAAVREKNRRHFVIHQDPTAPPVHRLHTPAAAPKDMEWGVNGTRVVFFSGGGSCSWAYAVSYVGAQKLVKAMSVDSFNSGFDNGMGGLCSLGKLNCVTVYPPIFGAYAPVGDAKKESDIANRIEGFRDKAQTHNIVYSVKQNLEPLIMGEREKAEPQWNEMPELKGRVSREYVL